MVGAGGFAAGAIQSGTLKGGLYGAFSAELFFGIGQYFDQAGWAHVDGDIGSTNLNAVGYSSKILAHGVAGGVMSQLQGGKFGNGFLSAGVAEAAAPAIDKLDPENPMGRSVSAERVVAASLVGGTTSVIAGGKFANGAVIAAFGRAFNEEMSIQATSQPKPVVVAFGGAGPSDLPDNVAIERYAGSIGAQYYESSVGSGADLDQAIRYILGELIADNGPVYILGYSAGGDAAIKLAAALDRYGISVAGLVTFDPHGATRPFGSYDYTLSKNVMSGLDIFQQNRAFPGSANPFKGGSVACPSCVNINLTGSSVTHLDIVRFGLQNYGPQINSTLGH